MGKILGIDYGSRRVGLAVSDPGKTIAFPLKTLEYRDFDELVRELVSLLSEEEIERIVVGFPLGMKGQRTKQTEVVEVFAKRISQSTGIPFEFVDERLSTLEATRSLHAMGYKPTRDKKLVDDTAAAIFLQSYLDRLTAS